MSYKNVDISSNMVIKNIIFYSTDNLLIKPWGEYKMDSIRSVIWLPQAGRLRRNVLTNVGSYQVMKIEQTTNIFKNAFRKKSINAIHIVKDSTLGTKFVWYLCSPVINTNSEVCCQSCFRLPCKHSTSGFKNFLPTNLNKVAIWN